MEDTTYRKVQTDHRSGIDYELMIPLTMLIWSHYKKIDFKLAVEREKDEKFDDTYWKISEPPMEYLCQLKHKETRSKTLSVTDLCDDKGSYSLPYYFGSYLKLKQQDDNFTFVLFVTIDFSESIKNGDDKIGIEDVDDIFDEKWIGRPYRIKFKDRAIAEKLFKAYKFFKTGEILATLLNNSEIEDCGLLKSCFVFLENSVIDFKRIQLRKQFKEYLEMKCKNDKFNKFFIYGFKKVYDYSFEMTEEISKKIRDHAKISFNQEKAFEQFDKELRTFLSKLIIIKTGKVSEMEDMIKEKWTKEYGKIKGEKIYGALYVKMIEWIKYRDEKGNGYCLTQDRNPLKEIVKPRQHHVKKAKKSFTGRVADLELLESKLREKRIVVISQYVNVSGGIGKSEMAKRYIEQHQAEFDDIVWMNARNVSNLVDSFKTLANDLYISTKDPKTEDRERNDKELVGEIYKYYEKSKMLFVFDDIDSNEGDENVQAWLPTEKNHLALVIARRDTKADIKLRPLSEHEAIQLAKKRLNESDDAIRDLLHLLYNYPLALDQAVSCLRYTLQNRSTSGDIYTILDYIYDFNAVNVNKAKNKYEDIAYRTCKVIVCRLREHDRHKTAIAILNQIAYFDNDRIDIRIFLNSYEKKKLSSAITLLYKYSMIGVEKNIITIHDLVQRVIREQMEENGEVIDKIKSSIDVLEKAMKFIKKEPDQVVHVISVYNHALLHPQITISNKKLSEVYDLLNANCHYKKCYKFQENVLKHFGEKHPQRLVLLENIGISFQNLGRYNESLDIFEQIYEETKEKDKRYALSIRYKIGQTQNHLSVHYDAIRDMGKLLRELDEDDDLGLLIREEMAHAHLYNCDNEEALRLLNFVYEKRLKNGSDVLRTLKTKQLLGTAYRKLKKYDEAYRYLKDVYEETLEMLGPDHPDTVFRKHGLASILLLKGSLLESLKMIQDVYEHRKGHLGRNHALTLRTLHEMGRIYLALEDYPRALEIFEEAVEGKIKVLEEKHVSTLCTYNLRAIAVEKMGDIAKAHRLFMELYDKQVRYIGAMHPYTRDTLLSVERTKMSLEKTIPKLS